MIYYTDDHTTPSFPPSPSRPSKAVPQIQAATCFGTEKNTEKARIEKRFLKAKSFLDLSVISGSIHALMGLFHGYHF